MQKAVLGGTWTYSLVQFTYDHREKKVDRRESRDLETVIRENALLPTSPFNSRITKITSYSTTLGSCFPQTFRKIAKHHFIEIRTACGVVFTFEKIKDCILEQLCPSPVAGKTPTVRRRRDGGRRPAQKLVIEDTNPRNHTILDVIKWINETEELKEPYHIVNSNCQHFCSNLWSKLSERSYPNPAKIGRDSSTDIEQGKILSLFQL